MLASAAIQTRNLSYRFYRREPLFEHIGLEVPSGSCFGLLGPNGAGKSTLMKLLLGLLRPSRGEVWLLGTHLKRGKQKVYRRLGVLVEEPKLYPHLTGYENLQVYATYRRLPAQRIQRVLDTTGMMPHAHKRVRAYSTGMKQRLGIALALLPDPELLFLDEPTNGLDPQGIAEIRRLILDLQQNRTVVLSSHLLSEVEQTCTHLGVLNEGQLLFQGPMEALLQRKREAGIQVLIELPKNLNALPLALPHEARPGGRFLIQLQERADIPELIDALRSRQIPVYQITIQERKLEESFLELFKPQG